MNKIRQAGIVVFFCVAAGLCGIVNPASSAELDGVAARVEAASKAVDEARQAIAEGKDLVSRIPEDSPYLEDVYGVLKSSASSWKSAVEALKGARESQGKVAGASSDALASDYGMLAKACADAASSGANVVKVGLAYVEAVALGKTESLGLLKEVMQDVLADSDQTQYYYTKVRGLIGEKYSK